MRLRGRCEALHTAGAGAGEAAWRRLAAAAGTHCAPYGTVIMRSRRFPVSATKTRMPPSNSAAAMPVG